MTIICTTMCSDKQIDGSVILRALRALGEILSSQGKRISIVAVGGVAMILQGFVQRTTHDLDIIAFGRAPGNRKPTMIDPPDPVPEWLSRAISRVARDFGLPGDWMNMVVGAQWDLGLPPGFTKRIHWERYGGLWFGVADRYDLIMLKLYAAVDSKGLSSVHFQDLIALKPNEHELKEAVDWVRSQDTSPDFARMLDQVVEHARREIKSNI